MFCRLPVNAIWSIVVMEGAEDKIHRAAQMLENASNILREAASTANSQMQQASGSNNQASSSNTTQASSSNSSVQRALDHCRNMIRNSTANGTYRRLDRSERLRAAAPFNNRSKTQAKQVTRKKKSLEFALLKCFGDSSDEDVGEEHHLKWDSVIANGMIMLDEEDDEKSVRNAIKESVSKKFPIIGANDFEFVKVRQKKISRLELGPGTEYNYSVVKKMAGQGLLYVKVKEGFECFYEESNDDSDQMLLVSPFSSANNSGRTDETVLTVAPLEHTAEPISEILTTNEPCEPDLPIDTATDVNPYDGLIDEINAKDLADPVEILKFLQEHLIKGRKLDVDEDNVPDPDDSKNATNYICVDRENILQTTFAELESINDFCTTFEVDFMGEVAKDYGGPRKEWIRLVNSAMKEKYFDKGLRDFLADDYFYVGVMMGIALLQNGQMPTILPLDIVDSLIQPSMNICVTNLQKGLNKFGLIRIFQSKPILLHLLRPSNACLTARILIQLLNPVFAPEGSTAYSKEKEVYSLFIKYIRQVASGRRPPVTLSSILTFVTGAAEEPVLGFTRHPTITFVNGQANDQASGHDDFFFIPTAHTCSNSLVLPRGPLLGSLPSEEKLFAVYDLAFTNTHFGIM